MNTVNVRIIRGFCKVDDFDFRQFVRYARLDLRKKCHMTVQKESAIAIDVCLFQLYLPRSYAYSDPFISGNFTRW